MKYLIIFLRLFSKKIKVFNVLCELKYQHKDIDHLIEFKILAYNQNEASTIAKTIISQFNQNNGIFIKFDKLWKINSHVHYFKNSEEITIDAVLDNKLKLNTTELKHLVLKQAFNHLEEGFEYVFKTDNPERSLGN